MIIMKKKLFIIASLSIIVLIAFFTLVNIMFKTNKLLMEKRDAASSKRAVGKIEEKIADNKKQSPPVSETLRAYEEQQAIIDAIAGRKSND